MGDEKDKFVESVEPDLRPRFPNMRRVVISSDIEDYELSDDIYTASNDDTYPAPIDDTYSAPINAIDPQVND